MSHETWEKFRMVWAEIEAIKEYLEIETTITADPYVVKMVKDPDKTGKFSYSNDA